MSKYKNLAYVIAFVTLFVGVTWGLHSQISDVFYKVVAVAMALGTLQELYAIANKSKELSPKDGQLYLMFHVGSATLYASLGLYMWIGSLWFSIFAVVGLCLMATAFITKALDLKNKE